MSLREKHKRERRGRILEAARRLIRTTGGVDFSMQLLAQEAEVALVTLYNLLGSKSGVLYALLNDLLDRVDEVVGTERSSKPLDAVLELAGVAADIYTDDAKFYRPLLQFLLGVRDLEHRPRLMEQSLGRWQRTVKAAAEGGLLDSTANQDLLARQLLIMFVGAVELWVHEELDDDSFRVHSLYGSALLVLGNASDAARPRITKRLQAIQRRLEPHAALFVSGQYARPPEEDASGLSSISIQQKGDNPCVSEQPSSTRTTRRRPAVLEGEPSG